MCGIFAYIGGKDDAAIKALRGLKDLEYRGYDSWGIAAKNADGGIYCRKAVGKISDVGEMEFRKCSSSVALGHTRWATHGKVSERNTHPHFNTEKTIAVVHNGIIENHNELREKLLRNMRAGKFRSQTDTEVIPHLISFYLTKGLSFEDACMKACRELEGRFAFVAAAKDVPFLFAARSGSPLVIGRGVGEYFVSSDTPAFLDYTNVVYYINNGECATIVKDRISFYDFNTGKTIKKINQKIPWEKTQASRAGQKHFMAKEIFDQKETLLLALMQEKNMFVDAVQRIKKSPHILFFGAGTAGHVSMVGEYLFSAIAGKEAHFLPAAEIHKALPFISSKSVFIAITQSGETADLLEAIDGVKKRRGKVLSILNVRGSSAERESFIFLPINAGPEKAVASTKAASSQMAVILLLAYALAGGDYKKSRKRAENSLRKICEWLSPEVFSSVKKIAEKISSANDLYVIGKGINYPIALEGALKIKEVSYIHAEGFAAGELKHGPIALIEKRTPCVVLMQNDEFKNDMLSSAEELKARGAYIIGIGPERLPVFDKWVHVPDTGDSSFLSLMIATQMLAYHLAVFRGHNPDMPRNLAKSVTVK